MDRVNVIAVSKSSVSYLMSRRTSGRANKGTNQYLEALKAEEQEARAARAELERRKKDLGLLVDEDAKITANGAQDTNKIPENGIEAPGISTEAEVVPGLTNGNSDEGPVRCPVCGTDDSNYNELTDPYGDMVQCDICLCWQHVQCMSQISDNAQGLQLLLRGDRYYCEKCDPEWFADAGLLRKRQKTQPEDYIANTNGNTIVDKPVQKEALKVAVPNSKDNAQTKLIANSQGASKPNPKPKPKPKLELAKAITGIERTRNNAAKIFTDLYHKHIIPDTLKAGKYRLPARSSIDSISREQAQILEQELFDMCYDKTRRTINKNYAERVRSIYSNLKDSKNLALKSHVINGELSAAKLVRMSPAELMNPDLKESRSLIADTVIIERPEIKHAKDEPSHEADVDEIFTRGPIPKRQVEATAYVITDTSSAEMSNEIRQGKSVDSEITEPKLNDEPKPSLKPEIAKEDPISSPEREVTPVREPSIVNESSSEEIPLGRQDEPEEIVGEEEEEEDWGLYEPNSDLMFPAEPLTTERPVDSTIEVTDSPRQTSPVSISIQCNELDVTLKTRAQYLGSTGNSMSLPHREVFRDGRLVVEGRLRRPAAESYLRQLRLPRVAMVYQVLRPLDSTQYDRLYNTLLETERVMGIVAKRKYTKNVYLYASESGALIDEICEQARARSAESERNMYLVVVIRQELLSSAA